MVYLKLILQYLKVLIWPVTVIIVIFIFKKYINVFLEKLTKVKFGNVELTSKEYSDIKNPMAENDKLEFKSEMSTTGNEIQKAIGEDEAIETTEGSSDSYLAKHLIFNEIYFNNIEIMGYIDKLLRMWPFLKTQSGLNVMPIEQKISLLVSSNKLDISAGRDVFNLYIYWLQNKDRINLIENTDELLKNYSTTRKLIIYLKSLT